MIVIDLPTPPSTNHLYFNVPGRGRRKSSRYRSWIFDAGWEIQIRKPGKIKGAVKVALEIEDKGQRDADNFVKPILDVLVTHGVIDGDGRKRVRDVSAKWSPDVSGVRVTVSAA